MPYSIYNISRNYFVRSETTLESAAIALAFHRCNLLDNDEYSITDSDDMIVDSKRIAQALTNVYQTVNRSTDNRTRAEDKVKIVIKLDDADKNAYIDYMTPALDGIKAQAAAMRAKYK